MDEIGFPEGQLVGNGMPIPLAEKVGDAFRTGKDMRIAAGCELSPALDRIIDRLENHSQRGRSND